eukprot:2518116-Pleurochrysis_carterae.AAC.2
MINKQILDPILGLNISLRLYRVLFAPSLAHTVMIEWIAAQHRARAAAEPSGPAVARAPDSKSEFEPTTSHQELAGVGCRLCRV